MNPGRHMLALSFVVLAAPLAACGGGGGSPALPPADAAATALDQPVRVPFSVAVPVLAASGRARRPAFVSSATRSAAVSFSSTRTTVECAQTCATTLAMAPGTVAVTAALYDAPHAAGHLLATGTATVTIDAHGPNAIAMTFNGVVAALKLALGPTALRAGAAASVPLSVTALDAAGATIVGSDAYQQPIALSTDGGPAATLSATSLTRPTDTAVLRYSGGSASATVRVTAAVPGTAVAAQTSALSIVAAAQLAPAEPARAADAFVNSVGVNVHLAYYGSAYDPRNFGRLAALLRGLGVRHLRDGAVPGQTGICREDQQLAAAGIRFDFLTSTAFDGPSMAGWNACAAGAAEAYEAPNEPDVAGNPGWAAVVAAYQRALYPAANGIGLPAIASALTSAGAYAQLGDLSAVSDAGNMHDYFAGHNPGTPGWGAATALGTYGSLAYNMHAAQLVSGTKPIWATETGYGEAAADPGAVSPAVKAHYELRVLLEHWNAGVARTYLYQLADQGGVPFSSYGLVGSDLSPKPAYTALAGLLAHLADPGPAFTPSGLGFTLTAPAGVHHALLQKRDGSYCLVLWNEVAEWNPDARAPLPAPAQAVTLSFASPPSALAQTSFSDAGSAATAALALGSGGTAQLSVSGMPTVVDIRR